MANRKMEKSKRGWVLTLRNGQTFEVVSETGKYYICEGTRFRKSNPQIARVMERRSALEAEAEKEKEEE